MDLVVTAIVGVLIGLATSYLIQKVQLQKLKKKDQDSYYPIQEEKSTFSPNDY